VKIANEVEDKLRNCKKNIKVAVMGCVVTVRERQEKLISESPEGSEKVF